MSRRFARAAKVRPALDALLASADRAAQMQGDPIELVHRYSEPSDQELVGLLASAVAYGRVSLFKPRLAALLDSLGEHPAAWAREASAEEVMQACRAFSYRMTGPGEIAALLHAGARLQRLHGSIGAVVEEAHARQGELRAALAEFVEALWDFDLTPFIGEPGVNRRLRHLVASPAGQSACKRLVLYVRWMVRDGDGVDLGLWKLPRSALVMPLDTHVHRISGLLGLTRREDLSWKTAEEITGHLRALDPEDPVKYDFALSHLGISGRCTSTRDPVGCAECPLKPLCRVWDRAR